MRVRISPNQPHRKSIMNSVIEEILGCFEVNGKEYNIVVTPGNEKGKCKLYIADVKTTALVNPYNINLIIEEKLETHYLARAKVKLLRKLKSYLGKLK